MKDLPPPRPIFEGPAEELERAGPEESLLGFLLGGMANAPFATLGAQYLKAAEVLFEQVESRAVWDHEVGYPALHILRHAMELLLKACLAPPPHGHGLGPLLAALAERLQRYHGVNLPAMAQTRITEFSCFDPAGVAFRYSQIRSAPGRGVGPVPFESHIDLVHLRRTIRSITRGLTELVQALRAGYQLAVLRALAIMGAAETHGGRDSN